MCSRDYREAITQGCPLLTHSPTAIHLSCHPALHGHLSQFCSTHGLFITCYRGHRHLWWALIAVFSSTCIHEESVIWASPSSPPSLHCQAWNTIINLLRYSVPDKNKFCLQGHLPQLLNCTENCNPHSKHTGRHTSSVLCLSALWICTDRIEF